MTETVTTTNLQPVRMAGWTAFLNSLATSGGNLFLLGFFSIILLFMVTFVMVHFGPASPSAITLVGSFSAFTGALIGILRGSRVDPVPPNMTATTSTTTSTIPPPAVPPIAESGPTEVKP